MGAVSVERADMRHGQPVCLVPRRSESLRTYFRGCVDAGKHGEHRNADVSGVVVPAPFENAQRTDHVDADRVLCPVEQFRCAEQAGKVDGVRRIV